MTVETHILKQIVTFIIHRLESGQSNLYSIICIILTQQMFITLSMINAQSFVLYEVPN